MSPEIVVIPLKPEHVEILWGMVEAIPNHLLYFSIINAGDVSSIVSYRCKN